MSTQAEFDRLRKANPFPTGRIENDALFAEIIATPSDPRLLRARRSGHREASKRAVLVAVAALLIVAAPVAALVRWSVFAPTEGQLDAERGGTFVPGSLRILRSEEMPAGVTWTVVTYKTTKYDCFHVYGGVTGSAQPAGSVGGCGGLRPFRHEEMIQGGAGGRLRVRSKVFSIAAGRAAPVVTTVVMTLDDGSTAVDHPVGGVWLFVGGPDRSPTRVEALDRSGKVVALLPLEPSGR